MGIPIIGTIISAAKDIIDEFHTSGEEKLTAHAKLNELQIRSNQQLLDYESKRLHEAASTIRAETGSGNWLAASWRPITMLLFGTMLALHWLGVTSDRLMESEILAMMDIVQLGLGGYIMGRTAEKVIPATVRAVKGDKS